MTTSGPYDAPGTSSATRPTSNPTRPVTGADSPTRAVADRDDERRHARETKPSFKTTELIVYLLSVLGVLIASCGWSTSTTTVNGSAPIRAGSWSLC